MKLFLSAGEPSGDLHGANLIRALSTRQPDTHVTALGGPLMRAAGADILYPLTDLAVMGLRRVILNIPTFLRVGNLAVRHVRTAKPDAVVLIDYPGFHFERREAHPRLRGADVLLRPAANLGVEAVAGADRAEVLHRRAHRAAVRGRLVPRPAA